MARLVPRASQELVGGVCPTKAGVGRHPLLDPPPTQAWLSGAGWERRGSWLVWCFWTVRASGFTASVCPDLVAHVPELMFLLLLTTVTWGGGLEGVSGGTGQAEPRSRGGRWGVGSGTSGFSSGLGLRGLLCPHVRVWSHRPVVPAATGHLVTPVCLVLPQGPPAGSWVGE